MLVFVRGIGVFMPPEFFPIPFFPLFPYAIGRVYNGKVKMLIGIAGH
jgi:hypothetical protein